MKIACFFKSQWTIHAASKGARALLLLTLVWVFLQSTSVLVHADEAKPLAEDPVVEARLVDIAQELRCLVCQNESLASSRADLADDLRREVRSLIKAGKSDDEIRSFLVSRYGDFVLYRPKIKPLTYGLWFGPFLVLVLGLFFLYQHLKARAATQQETSALTPEERERLRAILKEQ
jgi:cytochrome c-type biogenesis protein CcmH